MKVLNAISSDTDSDRQYVNKFFVVIFAEKYLQKLIMKGMDREKVLNELRSTKRYATMQGNNFVKFFHNIFNLISFFLALYEYRVHLNGKGNIEARKKQFKLYFRVKLNNWWISNGVKVPKELDHPIECTSTSDLTDRSRSASSSDSSNMPTEQSDT